MPIIKYNPKKPFSYDVTKAVFSLGCVLGNNFFDGTKFWTPGNAYNFSFMFFEYKLLWDTLNGPLLTLRGKPLLLFTVALLWAL